MFPFTVVCQFLKVFQFKSYIYFLFCNTFPNLSSIFSCCFNFIYVISIFKQFYDFKMLFFFQVISFFMICYNFSSYFHFCQTSPIAVFSFSFLSSPIQIMLYVFSDVLSGLLQQQGLRNEPWLHVLHDVTRITGHDGLQLRRMHEQRQYDSNDQ